MKSATPQTPSASLAAASPSASTGSAFASDALFNLVDRLSALPRFDAAGVKSIVGVELVRQPEGAQPYFWIDVGAAPSSSLGPLVRHVELRVSKTDPDKTLLIVDVAPSPCHDIGALRQHYGSENQFTPPSPHAPTDAPFYVEFPKARDAGRLSFGFSRGEPACLVSLVFDRIKR